MPLGRRRKLAPLIVILSSVFLILATGATIVKDQCNRWDESFIKDGETYSSSVGDARSRGTLVTQLVARPNDFEIGSAQILFGDIWLEERAISAHQLVWLPSERRVGGYNLCFTLAEGDEFVADSRLFFVVNDDDSSCGPIRSAGRVAVYVKRLAARDVSDIKLSLLSAWTDPRGQSGRSCRFVEFEKK